MDNKPQTIGIIPSFCIIILAIGLMNHVMVIPPLLEAAKRDAWISVLAVIPPFLVWSTILYFIMKRTKQQSLLAWIQEHYGKWVSWPIRMVFIVYLFFISLMTLKDTVMWAHVSYLPKTPQLMLSISLILLCCFAAHNGLRAIAITSGILLPFVIVFGDFVMSSNLPAKNYTLLTPLLEHGLEPVLKGTLFVGGGLVELIMILLIQDRMKSKVRLWSVWLLAIFLIVLVFGPVTGAIAEFGPAEAAELRYPAFEEWRLVRIGKYIRHVDFLSIYQWLSGAFARISISLLLLIELLAAQNKKKQRMIGLILLGTTNVVLVELPISDMQYVSFLNTVYLHWSLWIVTGMLLVLLALVLLPSQTRRKSNET